MALDSFRSLRQTQIAPRMARLRFLPAILSLLVAGCSSAALAQSQSGFTYNGVVYTSYQAGEYQETPQGPQGAAAIRATGANYTSVLATQYVQTYTSNTIAPETSSTAGYNGQKDPLSPTDAAVVTAIQNLQAQGLTVVLKPQVDSLDGIFRGDFAPTDPATWFASYQTFILHYAQLASQNGVGDLIIGTEFVSLSGSAYKTYWDNIIAQIRASYPNLTLIYGANATYSGDEFTTVSFWDKVDIIGVDGYFPLTNHADPTVAQLVAAWSDNSSGFNIVAGLKNLQSQYNKPLIFTEIGYVSAAGTNEEPYALAATGAALDTTEQQNCYEAFFEVFSRQTEWMKGVFWWAWSVSPPAAGDREYTPQNKPAAEITLPEWFGSTTAGFTLAPSNQTLTFLQGQTAADTVSVTNLGGFTGAVTLAATGLPAGVTASFAPGTAAGTQILTLTAAAGAAVTAQPATITLTGTSGSLTASTQVALVVQAGPPGFTLAPSAGTLSLIQSGTGTVTISVNDTGSFTGAVTLAASNLPAGVTVAFATNPATSSSVLTLTASSTAAVGPATITITGTSGTLSASTTLTLNVAAPAPVFTLAPSAGTLSVAQGASGSVTVAVSGNSSFSGAVTLAASNLPAGVTATFGTNPATSSSVLTFAASSTAALGSATVTITGTSGTLSASTTVALTVTAAPTFTLTPTSPAVSVAVGGSATDTLAVAGRNGFTGSVSLSAAVTSSPAGAQNIPTVSFGATSPVTVAGSAGGSATLSISTTPSTSAALTRPAPQGSSPIIGGGIAMAGLLLLGLSGKRRRAGGYHSLTLIAAIAFLFTLTFGIVGCGGGSSPAPASTGTPGTTAGTYTINVTATSGSITSTSPITLTVQ